MTSIGRGDVVAPAVLALGIAATLFDFRTRRIPNALTIGAAAAALVCLGLIGGWRAVAWSGLGWAVGLLIFLPLFLLRGLGAGDVKLLAAFGAWLGPNGAWWVAVYGAIAGGVIAVPWLLLRGALAGTLANIWTLIGYWRVAGPRPHPGLTLDSPHGLRLPYALPLALGAVATLWLRGSW